MLTARISKWFLLIQRKEDQNYSNGQKDENDCPIVKLFCFHLVGKSRGLKEGQIDSGRYELLVLDKKKTCKRQNKKSWQHNGDLDKWMVWKGAASVHGRIKIEIAWDTIRWAQCDNRNAGHKNADDDKQDEIFFSEIHILRTIVLTTNLYHIVVWNQGFYEIRLSLYSTPIAFPVSPEYLSRFPESLKI